MIVYMKSLAVFEPEELFASTYIYPDQHGHLISGLFYSLKMKTHGCF